MINIKSNILVSVIIPNYNHASFLKQRMESIYNQTYQNFEVILLDDASVDNSLDILQQYKKHPKTAHFIINKTNSGSPFKQWKKGIELAKGQYIWIAESDDYCKETFLEEAIRSLENCHNSVLFFCQSQIIDENDNFLQGNPDFTPSKYGCINGEKFIKDELIFRNKITNASACVFNKKIAVKYIDKLLDFKMAGDWMFWTYLLNEGNIFASDKKLNYFRATDQSTRIHNTIQKRTLRLIEELNVIDKIFSIVSTLNEAEKKERIKDWKTRWCYTFYTLSDYKNFLLPSKINLFTIKINKYELLKHFFKFKFTRLLDKLHVVKDS